VRAHVFKTNFKNVAGLAADLYTVVECNPAGPINKKTEYSAAGFPLIFDLHEFHTFGLTQRFN